jgi:hypothetical protein
MNIERQKLTAIYFKLMPEQRALIEEKMKLAGIRNMSAYIRKMAIDGYVIRLDLSDVRKMVQLLSNATNNLNQISRRVNETGSIYESDIRDLREQYSQLWDQTNAILRGLAKINASKRGKPSSALLPK